jgi:hypothetical protein
MQCCELPREKLVLIVGRSLTRKANNYVPENTSLVCGRVFTPGQRNNWGWGRKQLPITKPLILWVRCDRSGSDGKSVKYCVEVLPQLVPGTCSLKVDGITCQSLSPASNEFSVAWAECLDTCSCMFPRQRLALHTLRVFCIATSVLVFA